MAQARRRSFNQNEAQYGVRSRVCEAHERLPVLAETALDYSTAKKENCAMKVSTTAGQANCHLNSLLVKNWCALSRGW